MHVLVVEEDIQLAKRVSSALMEAGHDPIFVHDGERALNEVKEIAFDLIVLDITLPGMDGFEWPPGLAVSIMTVTRRIAGR